MEAGATFYAYTTIPSGEFPQLVGGPFINRVGCENFVAVKYEPDGRRKVWISASAGAFQVTVSGGLIITTDWEYQIRYFSGDTATSTPEKMEIGLIPGSGNFGPGAAVTGFSLDYAFSATQ